MFSEVACAGLVACQPAWALRMTVFSVGARLCLEVTGGGQKKLGHPVGDFIWAFDDRFVMKQRNRQTPIGGSGAVTTTNGGAVALEFFSIAGDSICRIVCIQ
jgi:hypothetical protein